MITDKKILQSEVEANYVKSVSGNKLTGTVTENKNVFDKFPQLITNKFNALIDLLNQATDGDSGADNVKITSVTGRTATSVQGIIEELNDDSHTHTNKDLLDTYTQTEANLSDAVLKKHAHANAELLNSYTQTEVDIADAVTKKHSHANKSLLDTYAQTESNLADAVTKKHTHSNKSVLDGITSTLLTALNGIATMFEGIVSVTTTLGADNTTIPTSKAVADAISVAGGGDMLKSSYDMTNTGNKVDKAIGDEDGANIKSTYATKTELANKVDKVTGKGLSTNDFTNAQQTKLGNVNARLIIATNKTVAVTDFVADTTYEDYPYKANISVTGATTDYYPEVVFGVTEANSGNYAPVSSTGSGVVTIYAVEPPTDAITIPTIKLEKVVS